MSLRKRQRRVLTERSKRLVLDEAYHERIGWAASVVMS